MDGQKGERIMKVAMMVRGYLPVPRSADMIYAPIDLAVAIAEGLAKRGHEVDFFAPLGSQLPTAHVQTLNLRPLARNQQEFAELLNDIKRTDHYIPSLWDNFLAAAMFAEAKKGTYDLLHFHHPEVALPLVGLYPDTPVVATLHDPIYPWYKELFELHQTDNQHYISISDNQRRDAPDLPYLDTVYNGIDTDFFEFSNEPEDYLLTVGRILSEKGVKEAVQLAIETNHRLLIIGPVYQDSQGYFDQYIKPYLSDRILFLGHIERKDLIRYYQHAKAYIAPLQWEEPFGLTMIEAMACGTPVIALRRGSVSEIVADGKSGFVVNSMKDMADALKRVGTIDRKACREHVMKHFSLDKMVDGYEAAFKKAIRLHAK